MSSDLRWYFRDIQDKVMPQPCLGCVQDVSNAYFLSSAAVEVCKPLIAYGFGESTLGDVRVIALKLCDLDWSKCKPPPSGGEDSVPTA